MDRSEQINELATALALAQAEIQHAEKASENPHLNKKYASLASVWDACRGPLTKNGLSVAQFVVPSEPGTLRLVTMLMHKSGQFLSGMEEMPVLKNDPQTYGAAVTYARRFGLAAMAGVCPDDDTDGEGLNGKSQGTPQHRGQQSRNPQTTRPQAAPPAAEPASNPALALSPEVKEAGKAYAAAYCQAFNCEIKTSQEKQAFRHFTARALGIAETFESRDLTVAQYQRAMSALPKAA